jgi:SagB-type dehydrogenase family enzyme
LVNSLSEYESSQLLSLVERTAGGNRFWETDIATLYNEYVKIRYFNVARNVSAPTPPAPVVEEGIFAPIPILKSYSEAERVILPAPGSLGAGFSETLLNRRSQREFTGDPISLETLSALLQHGCGTTGFAPAYGYTRLPLRTFPSSGGLQAPEVYLSIQAVESVSPGIYHYHPVDHVLELLEVGTYGSTLRNLALDQPWVETSSVVMIVTGYYERLRWKYQARGFRFMCMDAGFLGENICLTAQALSLGACAIAGFIDDALETLLGIDGEDEVPLLLICVGVLSSTLAV